MTPYQNTKVILFDLDSTLFDHQYSLKKGINAVKDHFKIGLETDYLIETFSNSLEKAYDKYLDKIIPFEEKDNEKVRIFFEDSGLGEFTEIESFLNVYTSAYKSEIKATKGSLETLESLSEKGYRLGMITNGQIKNQNIKSEKIGIKHFFERIITSEEIGCAKPNPIIFKESAQYFKEKPENMIMIGDSIKNDIKGAISVNMPSVLYDPNSKTDFLSIEKRSIPVVSEISGVLNFVPGFRFDK